MFLYPALLLGAYGALALWVSAASGAEQRGRGLGAPWLLLFAVATLPGYLLGVGAMAARLRALQARPCAAVAGLSAVLTPTLAVGALAIAGRVGGSFDALANVLRLAGPLLSGAVAVSLSYRILAGRALGRAPDRRVPRGGPAWDDPDYEAWQAARRDPPAPPSA